MLKTKKTTRKKRETQAFNREFAKMKRYLLPGPCERCGKPADTLHHRKLRSHSGTNHVDNLMLVDAACHDYIHKNPEESYERGWMIKGIEH